MTKPAILKEVRKKLRNDQDWGHFIANLPSPSILGADFIDAFIEYSAAAIEAADGDRPSKPPPLPKQSTPIAKVDLIPAEDPDEIIIVDPDSDPDITLINERIEALAKEYQFPSIKKPEPKETRLKPYNPESGSYRVIDCAPETPFKR